MTDRAGYTESADPRVEAALLDYLERLDSDEPIDRESFLACHPEVADALKHLIDAEDQLRMLPGDIASREVAGISTRTMASEGQKTLPPKSQPDFALAASPAQLCGQFGRYDIIRFLDCGKMGAVYLALDTQLKRNVAIKIPHFDDNPSEESLKRFYREAEAAAMLRHANICPVFDVGQIEGKHFISMAYIEGGTLADLIDSQQITTDQQLAIAQKLARALQHAHDHGIVHRDLKPANIMVDRQGEPIITDFGLARRRCPESETGATQNGRLLGSPAYMSPEQVEGDPDKVGPASDQYSLGVVLYQMLTGQLPFRGSVPAVLGQIVTTHPARPSERCPGLDPRIESVCLRMMSKKIPERFPTMTAVADQLHAIANNRRAATSAPKDVPVPDPSFFGSTPPHIRVAARRFRPRWSLLALGAAASAAVLAVIVLYVGRTAIILDIKDPDLQVAVKGTTLILTGPRMQTVRVEPGEQTLDISFGGLRTSTKRFSLTTGETRKVSVAVADHKIVAHLDNEILSLVPAGDEQLNSRDVERRDGRKAPTPAQASTAAASTHLSPSAPPSGLSMPATSTQPESSRESIGSSMGSSSISPGDPERKAAKAILTLGGTIRVRAAGRELSVKPGQELPQGPIHLTRVYLEHRPDLADSALEPLRDLSHVLTVNLEGDHHIGDAGLAHLAELGTLQDLNLHGTQVTDAGLASLEHLPHLEALILGRTKITDAGLSHLEGLKNLRTIFLGNGPRITDMGLSHLQHLTALEAITLWGAPVKGPGLKYLTGLKRLRFLGLGRTRVTDDGLEHLQGLQSLKRLEIGNTKVTAAGLQKLRRSLPHCRIASNRVAEEGSGP